MLLIPCLKGKPDVLAGSAGFWGSLLPAVWSFMLALRERGIGSAWTTLHLINGGEQRTAELLGIPFDRYSQAGLFPIAYTQGTEFKPASRLPASTARALGCMVSDEAAPQSTSDAQPIGRHPAVSDVPPPPPPPPPAAAAATADSATTYGSSGGLVREHPAGTTMLVFGILSLVICGIARAVRVGQGQHRQARDGRRARACTGRIAGRSRRDGSAA